MFTLSIRNNIIFLVAFAFLLHGTVAWAISTEEFIMNSWMGRPQEELVRAWGRPSNSQIIPGSETHWLEYSNQSSIYVPPTSYTNTKGLLNTYSNPYGNTYGYLNSSSVTNTYGGYYQNYSCNVNFGVDSSTLEITTWSYRGNMCKKWYVYPAHISITTLNDLKSTKKEVLAFQQKIDKSLNKVSKIRKDTNAYKMGLRNNDIIIKSEIVNNDIKLNYNKILLEPKDMENYLKCSKLEIKRKKHLFTKELVTKTFLFTPTYHSQAYELLSKSQRRLFGVVD